MASSTRKGYCSQPSGSCVFLPALSARALQLIEGH